MTAMDLVTRALRILGAIGPGESLDPQEASDALVALNGMIDRWGAERLMIYAVERATLDLVVGKQTYTIGPGGDWDRARPTSISGASVTSFNNAVQPLELPLAILSQQEWQMSIPVKNVESALPQSVYYEPYFPLGRLSYWPVPNVASLQAVLYLPTAITKFVNLSTQYTFPPGYEEAILYNLALRLSMEYPANNRLQDIVAMARDAMMVVKIVNVPDDLLHVDKALVSTHGVYDWRSDQGG